MKKLIALGISLLLLVPLAGCRADEDDTSTTPNTEIEEEIDVDDTQKDAEQEKKDASDDNVDEGQENTNGDATTD